jgi:beta-mannosidase
MPAELLELTDWEIARTGADEYGAPGELPVDLDWVPARVPGTVAGAWRAAGRWSMHDEFDFDADDWWLRGSFTFTAGPARLDFGGIATIAQVWLNGCHLFDSDNMFHQHRVDVDLQQDNELMIVCRSLTAHLAHRRPRPRWRTRLVESQNLRWVRTTFLGRMPSSPPRCAPVGLWRPVSVAETPDVVVESVLPRLVGGVASVEVSLLPAGVEVSSAALQLGDWRYPLDLVANDDRLRGRVHVDDVEPWFPATHGSPHLYDCAVIANVDGNERIVDERRIGFRSVLADQGDGGFALAINGTPVFCRGAVWSPNDPVNLHGDRAAMRDDVHQLVSAGVNMLRIAGTGVYAQPELLDLCDELGVLIWHDLMFANVDQPLDDDSYRTSVRRELQQFMTTCQSHPSVVVLCGGSEVEQQAAMMGVDSSGAHNAVGRELLPLLVEQLLPDLAHVPCSPSGGDLPFQVDTGISHYFGVGAYRRPLIDARLCGARFVTEALAFAAVPSSRSLQQWDIDGREPGSAAWKRGVPRDRGAGWDFDDVRDHYVEEVFGVRPLDVRYADPERYLDLGRAAVAESVRATVAEFRRPTSPCRGVLVLSHRDLLAGAGWGLLDASGRPKSSFYGLQHASAARQVSLFDEGLNGVRAAIHNDCSTALVGELHIRLFAVTGAVVDQTTTPVKLEAASAVELGIDALFGRFTDLSYAYRFGPAQIDVIEATLVDDTGEVWGRAHHLPCGQRRDRRVDLGLRAWTQADSRSVTVRADQFAQFVTLDLSDGMAEDDWFHLSPGQERTIAIGRSERTPAGSVHALNGHGSAAITTESGS